MGCLTGASQLLAAPGDWVKGVIPIAVPAQPAQIVLPVATPRANPAHEAWAQQEPGMRLVYNVVQPALIPLPCKVCGKRPGPAVILVPGGGYQFLSIDNEGYDVARRLERLGVRTFILKYRTLPLPDSFQGFHDALVQLFVKGAPASSVESNIPYAVADAEAALRAVRSRAGDLRVDPTRVGLLGFSAGAMTVLSTLQDNAADARADFAGMLYGPTQLAPVPPKAPPLFAAIAADDRFFSGQDLGLIHAWRQSGASVELHLYSAGGHGFASHPNGTTSDAWFDQFALWLKARGVTRAK